MSAAEASDAGQKSMEHMQGLLLACSAKEDVFRKEIAETYDDPKAPLTPLDRGDPAVLASFSKEKCDALLRVSRVMERGSVRRYITTGGTHTHLTRHSQTIRALAIIRGHLESIGRSEASTTNSVPNAKRNSRPTT